MRAALGPIVLFLTRSMQRQIALSGDDYSWVIEVSYKAALEARLWMENIESLNGRAMLEEEYTEPIYPFTRMPAQPGAQDM